ncbi:MAG: endonuclease domain-containing protein [bacterium]
MSGKRESQHKRELLVGVIRRKSDYKLLFERKSYRIPLRRLNPIGVKYVAFYLPSRIFSNGGRIEMYGVVDKHRIFKRKYLPNFSVTDSDSEELYINFYFKKLVFLKNPLLNKSSMRVSLKRTDFRLLRKKKTIAELYDIKPLEEIMGETLLKWGKLFRREYTIKTKAKRYRLDFAFFCRDGILGLECDSDRWHSSKNQMIKDRERDILLEKAGVRVIHFDENQSLMELDRVTEILEKEIEKLGGLTS